MSTTIAFSRVLNQDHEFIPRFQDIHVHPAEPISLQLADVLFLYRSPEHFILESTRMPSTKYWKYRRTQLIPFSPAKNCLEEAKVIAWIRCFEQHRTILLSDKSISSLPYRLGFSAMGMIEHGYGYALSSYSWKIIRTVYQSCVRRFMLSWS